MVLPDAASAVAWLLDTARTAIATGDRIDLDTVLVLRALAPDDPVVSDAIERLDPHDDPLPQGDVAARARHVAAALRIALDAHDEELGRQVVSDLESELLRVYRPGQTLGSLEADVAMASLLLDIWDAGQQLPHQMMAEELMLMTLRLYWGQRHAASFESLSEVARTLARLYQSTGKAEYHDHAVTILRDLGETFQTHGLAAARYVLALQLVGSEPEPRT